AIVITMLLSSMVMAQGMIDVTSPFDTVVGVPDDGIEDGGDDSGWPPNELPPFAFDDQILTKYLHFKGNLEPTGLRVTPAMGSTIVTGLSFTTANDAEARDPVGYELSGSNESINGPYTLIASGRITDFEQSTAWPRRTINETPITFDNDVAYAHYQVMFPRVRDAGGANSMQIAEVELLMRLYKASAPSPADGEILEQTWVTLGWTAGYDAVSHDVYISDNLADVENSAPEAFAGNHMVNFLIVGFPGNPFPDGLVPGTTYYWRIDEIEADGETKHEGDIWSFTVPPYTAWKPSPPNNSQFIDPNADLSWNPGWGAKLHYVYFGDNFDDVNNATGATMQITTSYALDTLELGKTYYWRVDESDGRQTYTGDVWSFTATSGGGGLKGEYFANENLAGAPAYTQLDQQIDFSWSDSPGLPLQNDNWSVRWTADLNILLEDTYTFSVWSEGGTRLWIDGQQVIDMWVSWVGTRYASIPMFMEAGTHTLRLEFADFDRNADQQLYWEAPSVPEQIIPAGPLQPPTLANIPNPGNNAKDVKQAMLMSWSPADKAASSQLYLGTDKEAVKNADAASPEYKGSMELDAETYDPGALEWNTTYYWRVDGVNDLNTDSPWTGLVWNFTTADFLVIDDFEDYDIDNKEIWWFWKDGLGYGPHGEEPGYAGNGTGSAVGIETTASYMEHIIVHGGNKSMPVYFDNTIAGISEVELALGGIDLTQNGGTTLKLFFYGTADNAADPIYVAINGVAVEHEDPAAAQIVKWVEWNIPLQAFVDNGADVTNATSITIGIGSSQQAGGTGTMYFDDVSVQP
ncbi:MAG: PA14 domain-containing protein, partial [Planctomycetota bacterium]